MKNHKAVWVLTFLGIFLVLSAIVLGGALINEYTGQNGSVSMQKVMVSVKNQLDRQGVNSFSPDDIKRLKRELETKDISYTAQSGLIGTSVSNDSAALPVTLTGVDYSYPLFNRMILEVGSFITEKQEQEEALVAVIDEELAWALFKTKNVVGKTLEIYDALFKIIGILEKDETILGALTDDGLPEVYIPAAVMLELDATASIASLQIKTADSGTLDQNTAQVSAAIRQIGKTPSNYNMRDYNLKHVLMKQKPLMMVFALGILSIRMLTVHVKNTLMDLYFLIREECKRDYLTNVLKHKLKEVAGITFEAALALTGIALIWSGIRFSLYIPPKSIPDELINISHYADLIKDIIQGAVQSRGYIAPRAELIINAADMLLNLLLYICFTMGLLLHYAGSRELKTLDMENGRLTAMYGLLFTILGFMAVGVSYKAGLHYMPDIKAIIAAWVYLFLSNVNITKRKESDVQNV